MKYILLILLYSFIVYPEDNTMEQLCLKNHSIKNIRLLLLDRTNYEICFEEAKKLIANPKTEKSGIALMTKFLYSKNTEYIISAIWELTLAESKTSINDLYNKGIETIHQNNPEVLENIVSSLLTLNAKKKILELAKYSQKMKKRGLTDVIRKEYMAFTSGEDFLKMEKIAGPIFD